jgi:Domain of unknown function (DUF4262)
MADQACPCAICTVTTPAGDETIIASVREHGWAALRVPGTYEFAYTVGLWHTFQRPELVMFGLHGEHMQLLLNDCVAHGREDGWPGYDTPFDGVLDGFPMQLRPVHETWRDAFFGTAHRFYRGWPVPVAQLVWPDAHGKWPWQKDATASSRTRQAFTWLPVAEHPAGSWRLLGHFGNAFPLAGEPDSWALTTRSVLDGTRNPTAVLLDDDAFDVLDDRGHDADDLCVTYLGTLVLRVPALRELGDLTNGTAATTDGEGGGWQRGPLSTEQREASAARWQNADRHLPA